MGAEKKCYFCQLTNASDRDGQTKVTKTKASDRRSDANQNGNYTRTITKNDQLTR